MSLTLGMWACDCRVWLSGGCHGLWVARDVRGGGCCMWVTWWQAVVEVVVEKEGMSLFVMRVTFGSTLERARALSRLHHARAQICSVHSFVMSVIQFFSVQYTIV